MKSKNLSIILPTFNESGNIIKLINSILIICKKNNISTEIIMVDDDSQDLTGIKTINKFKNNHSVKVFIRKKNKGLASAILYGINHSRGKYILVMDTDFNHNPKEIPIMFMLSKKFDLVIGSRYIKNGGMENRIRQWFSYYFNLYIRVLLNHDISDNLSGFFITKRSILKKLELYKIFFGFGDYFIRLIYIIYRKKYSITETPVFYKNRTYGISKSKFFNMFVTYTKTVINLRFSKI
ncbi:MAG: hypothetical protein UR52_C0001G0054 [Candidatus Gottesmanbacteria bacterium GW2011_GWA1_34_13]|uniref:Glycosyltransferase 2-like domain-containing protein n=1 Tax=Candidatus Gottesmanbacteria bacterium GW2011_GWA1_34_13 TaxID=1618434 RepID=A0A0G0ASR8_9BACT|nr:MAG: hypothetical protein UR52_C0001G0054 [Candidatus Gottesmanbacteria bacterium GW2011_GWA1_34_13]